MEKFPRSEYWIQTMWNYLYSLPYSIADAIIKRMVNSTKPEEPYKSEIW